MTPLGLIADDLTGALDSAAQFTGRFGAVPVLLRPEAVTPPGSFALDLNCRDGSEAVAVSRARATAGRLGGADIAFKKIDSLLRGHWAAELAAIMELGLFDRVILAPAFPAQGRVTRGGRQYARSHDGKWHLVPIDPAHDLTRRGVVVYRGTVVPAGRGEPTPACLCDAETDLDLAELVAIAQQLPGRTLWCGSAGLARALAAMPPTTVEPRHASHLVLVGSNHAVTYGQLAQIERVGPQGLARFDADAAVSAAEIGRVLAHHRCCIAVPSLPAGMPATEAADRIARWLGAILPLIPRPESLTVVGGETFAAVCRGLGVGVLSVEGEWRPGVPASRMDDGAWAGTRCFSKSGAFGNDDLLLDLLGQRMAA